MLIQQGGRRFGRRTLVRWARDQRMIGLRVTAWGPQADRVQRLEPEINAALERLATALSS